VVDVIHAVGNYGEMYDSTVGPNTRLGIPRGLNALWKNGGLMYAPPIR
jgi:general L-amino acid transport system substrate-binding protein